jgi:hypothetical protein
VGVVERATDVHVDKIVVNAPSDHKAGDGQLTIGSALGAIDHNPAVNRESPLTRLARRCG